MSADWAMPESRDAVIREIEKLKTYSERSIMTYGESFRLSALEEELAKWPTVDDLSKKGYVRRDAVLKALSHEDKYGDSIFGWLWRDLDVPLADGAFQRSADELAELLGVDMEGGAE